MAENKKLSGPDLKSGVEFGKLSENEPFLGHYEGEAVILVRQGDNVFAVAGTCTHYGGPLAEGLLVGNTIRCPWHHARFDIRTGEAEGAPALNPLSCFQVRRDGNIGRNHRKEGSRFPRRVSAESFLCRDHWRRGSGSRLRGHAPDEGIFGTSYARCRRATEPGGPAKSLQGLPGWLGAGRMDSVTNPRLLSVNPGRPGR